MESGYRHFGATFNLCNKINQETTIVYRFLCNERPGCELLCIELIWCSLFKGSINVTINATDLFDTYEDHYYGEDTRLDINSFIDISTICFIHSLSFCLEASEAKIYNLLGFVIA